MPKTQRQEMILYLFGPDPRRVMHLHRSLQARLGTPHSAPPEPGISLQSEQMASYAFGDTTVHQTALFEPLFPGEPMLFLGGDACHTLVIPALMEAKEFAKLEGFFFVLRKRRARHLLIYVDLHEETNDEELPSLIAEELHRQLKTAGWTSGASIHFGALGEAEVDIDDLLVALGEKTLEAPLRPVDEPFLLYVEDKFNLAGDDTIATGQVRQGHLAVGDTVIMLSETLRPRRIGGIEMFRRLLDEAHPGENVGLRVEHTSWEDIDRGAILTKAPEDFTRASRLDVFVYFYPKERGGYHEPFREDGLFVLHLGTATAEASLRIAPTAQRCWDTTIAPGSTFFGEFCLQTPLWCRIGDHMPLRYKAKAVGYAVILDTHRGDP